MLFIDNIDIARKKFFTIKKICAILDLEKLGNNYWEVSL